MPNNPEPVPMPGAFTPVFSFSTQVAYDQKFSYNDALIRVAEIVNVVLRGADVSVDVFEGFEVSNDYVAAQITQMAIVGFAIHLAKVHKEMDLGDSYFDMVDPPKLPPFIAEYISSLGEFEGPDGRRWVLTDFMTTIHSLVRCAHRISSGELQFDCLVEQWLPTEVDDLRTKSIVAAKLSDWFTNQGYHFKVSDIRDHIFSGDVPPDITAIIPRLQADHQKIVVRLFLQWSSDYQFVQLFSDNVGRQALDLLGLVWRRIDVRSLCFKLKVHAAADLMLSTWKLVYPLYRGMMKVDFVPSSYHRPVGNPFQASVVKEGNAEYRVSSYYGLSAEDRNMLCCFGSNVVFDGVPMRYHADGILPARTLAQAIARQDLGL
jgi:hypothetical protein